MFRRKVPSTLAAVIVAVTSAALYSAEPDIKVGDAFVALSESAAVC